MSTRKDWLSLKPFFIGKKSQLLVESTSQSILEGTMRDQVILACTECKNRNYHTNKNKKNDPDRLEFKKYCKHCKKTTVHKETK